MAILNPFPQVSFTIEKSMGVWLSIWAIRYKAGIDYKLGAKARTMRWTLVLVCFAFTGLPGPDLGWLRVSSYLLGLVFLCWPNLAYHLGKLFEEWPMVEGRVDSVQPESGLKWSVAYDFEVSGERYGGRDSVKSGAGFVDGHSAEGRRVLIRYDPLNPGRSSRIQACVDNDR